MLETNIDIKYKKELTHAFHITIGTENKKIVFEKNRPEYNGLSITEIKDKIYSKIKKSEFNELLKRFTIDEDFLEEFAPVLDWDIISEYQQLSEDFMMLFIKEIKWNKAILFQELSEDFLENIEHIFELKDCSVNMMNGSIVVSNGDVLTLGSSMGFTVMNGVTYANGNGVSYLNGSIANGDATITRSPNGNISHTGSHRAEGRDAVRDARDRAREPREPRD